MEHLLNDFWRCSIGRVLRNGFGILQTIRAALPISGSPPAKAGLSNTKTPAGLAHTADLLGMLQNPKFTSKLPLIVRLKNFRFPKPGTLSEVSTVSVHIYTLRSLSHLIGKNSNLIDDSELNLIFEDVPEELIGK